MHHIAPRLRLRNVDSGGLNEGKPSGPPTRRHAPWAQVTLLGRCRSLPPQYRPLAECSGEIRRRRRGLPTHACRLHRSLTTRPSRAARKPMRSTPLLRGVVETITFWHSGPDRRRLARSLNASDTAVAIRREMGGRTARHRLLTASRLSPHGTNRPILVRFPPQNMVFDNVNTTSCLPVTAATRESALHTVAGVTPRPLRAAANGPPMPIRASCLVQAAWQPSPPFKFKRQS